MSLVDPLLKRNAYASTLLCGKRTSFAPHSSYRYYTQDTEHQQKTETEQQKQEQPEGEAGGPKEETSVEELRAKVTQLESEVKEKHEAYLRALADQQNLIKITKRDVENATNYSIKKFAGDLLDVADNLRRAIESVSEEKRTAENNAVLDALLEGVVMTEKVLLDTFGRHGIKKFSPLGEKFDPNFHNALFQVQDPNKEPGTVMMVQLPGFTLKERVLRPAQVGVVAQPQQ
ncbi:GrpE, mitochondrial [Balamuthia mandrillaris]